MIVLFVAIVFIMGIGSLMFILTNNNDKILRSVNHINAMTIIALLCLMFNSIIFLKSYRDLDYHKKRVEELTQQKKEQIEQLKQEVER